ncbi:MAG: DUF6986 family protein, partial [Actinomycetes bacterium]
MPASRVRRPGKRDGEDGDMADGSGQGPAGSLDDGTYTELDRRLAPVDAARLAAFPGDRSARQPVHTCYVPADAVVPGLAGTWGAAALAALDEHGLPDVGLLPELV